MTNDSLRELLHELGETQPPVTVPPDTYRRGRRSHRRRVVAVVATSLAVVTAITLPLTGLLPGGGLPSAVDPAGSGTSDPAMPDRLHDVPERLTSFTTSGERWHDDLVAPDLAIGTTAAVFPVDGGGAVVAVSARDGSYAGLDLPGFDERAYFRFDDAAVALSPDGNKLAWTWNRDVIEGSRQPGTPSGVRIADLRTGEVTDVRLRGVHGVYAHGFAWSPDGRYLVYNLDVVTDPRGGVRGTRNFRVQRLDTRTGETVDVTGVPRPDQGPAVSDRGEVAVVGNGAPRTWLPGRSPEARTFEGGLGEWTAAWAPDGRRVATGSHDRGWFTVGATEGFGLISRTAAQAPSGTRVRVLGWAGERVVLVYAPDDGSGGLHVATAPVRGRAAGEVVVEVEPGDVLTSLSLATDLLARPTREMPEPDWPTDWARVAGWGAGAAAAFSLGGWLLRRRSSTARP